MDLNQFEAGDKEFHLTNVAQMQRWLPWLRMFRGFRIAVDYQKLIIALFAVFLWWSGSHFLTSLFLDEAENPLRSPSALPLQQSIQQTISPSTPVGIVTELGTPLTPFETLLLRTRSVSWFFDCITNSIVALVNFQSFASWWHAWLQLLWGLAVAALFGGIISRMAAREFTGHPRSLVRDSKYALRQSLPTYLSPLIALASFAFFWGINWLCGFSGRIPVVGELVLTLFWGVFLVSGLCMFMLLLGLILGWPLMLCSGAVERNDTFDALSRAFSYLLNRPWYALFLALLAIVYGSLTTLFVSYATRLSIVLSLSSVGVGFNAPLVMTSFLQPMDLRDLGAGLFENEFASGIIRFWIGTALLVPAAFAFSYFWCSMTISYFLLRRREDGTPLHEIELSDSRKQQKPELAVVGIPAADLRESND